MGGPAGAGSGSPAVGVPIGRHMLWGEVVCLDPLEWLRSGLVTNPGMFVLGQPGVGKSSLAKRLITGMAGYGTHALILGDTKPDYTRLVEHLGGQVIRVGRGLDRINPLDAGPLGAALARMSGRRAGAPAGNPRPADVAAAGAVHPGRGPGGSPTPRKSSSAGPSTCSPTGSTATPPSPTCWP